MRCCGGTSRLSRLEHRQNAFQAKKVIGASLASLGLPKLLSGKAWGLALQEWLKAACCDVQFFPVYSTEGYAAACLWGA